MRFVDFHEILNFGVNVLRKILAVLSTGILLLVNYTAFSQPDYTLRNYHTTDGLAHNFVQSICQDKTGFIWIATWDGLSRFDGTEFKNYYCNPEDSTSLPFFCFDKVLTDRFDNLLVFCENRPLSIYNSANDRFERLKINGESNIVITGIDIDSQGITWLTGTNSIYKGKDTGQNFSILQIVNELGHSFQLNYESLIKVDNIGTIWLYKTGIEGLTIWKGSQINDSTIKVKPVKPIDLQKYRSFSLHNFDQFDIYQTKAGNTWLFSKYGLFLFNTIDNEFSLYTGTIHPEEFTDRPYFTWFDDSSGLHIIDTEKKSHFNIGTDSGTYFETAFFDMQHTLWCGTISKSTKNIALKRYIWTPDYFKHYLTENSHDKESNQVVPILKDRFGDIWIGAKGLDHLVRIKADGTIQHINYFSELTRKYKPKPLCMLEDSTGIWLGCSQNYLFYYNFSSQKFSTRLSAPTMIDGKPYRLPIHNILKNKEELILNFESRISTFNIRNDELTYQFNVCEIETHSPAFTMVSDKKDGYWLGSGSARLFHLNSQFKADTIFRFQNRQEIIQHILPGDNNDIWIALQGGGLGHQFLKESRSELFTTTNGLANNTLYSLLKDKTGRLWIAHDQGISCFNPRNNQFRNFGKEDGINIENFNGDSNFTSKEGELFFGGINGLISFFPDKIITTKDPIPPIIITSLSVSGVPRYFDKAVNEMGMVYLEKGDNNLNISFSVINFKDDLKKRYRNRLIGVSDVWKETDSKNRNIAFFNLKPGNYKLEIEAADKNGHWDSKTAIEIRIPFRIYETRWFKIIIALLLIITLSGWIINYNKQIRWRARREQDELRLEALRNQMNPHFIFNSLNSINYFISKNDKISANHYIADFSRLIRSFITNLTNDFIPIETELQLLHDYLELESLRFGDKFTYTLATDNLVEMKQWLIFPGIIQPFVENAIWHGINGLEGRKGHVAVYFKIISPMKVQCFIEDDGIGRRLAGSFKKESSRKKTHGMGIIHERLRLHNTHYQTNYQVIIKDLFPDKEETGTQVIVELPVMKNSDP